MSVLFHRYLNILPALAAACLLAACATTDTDSETGTSAESETPAQVESDAAEVDVAEVVEPLEDDADMSQSDTQMQTDPVPVPLEAESASDGVTTGSAQTDVVEGVAVFPEQRYEIEEPLEFETDSDEEIDRLRDELAASESDLARSRAREAERDYASDQAGSSADQDSPYADQDSPYADSDEMGAASSGEQDGGPPTHTTTAQAGGVPTPDAGERDFPPGKPAEFSIYFGYNQASLELEFENVVVMHAEYLKENPDLTIEIQGNCDERGSREYNIALGGRRAHTVKRALELLGIEGDRIRSVSFGAEKPIAFGHDEESWRLNRRADIIY